MFPRTTLSHFRSGMERGIFREEISQRLRLLLLHRPPTHSLSVIGLQTSNHRRDQCQRSAPSQRTILHVHGGPSAGREVPPALAGWLVPRILPATANGIHFQRPRHLSQDCTSGKLNLYDFYSSILQKTDNCGRKKVIVSHPLPCS